MTCFRPLFSFAVLLLALVVALPAPSAAQSKPFRSNAGKPATAAEPPVADGRAAGRIAAVVNDEAITASDLADRLRLAMVSSGLQDTPETRQRLSPQVLRGLIDERLQVQEAKRLGVSVPDQEVEKALSAIAEQNRMTRAQMEQFVRQNNIPLSTLTSQIRANLAWGRLVQRKLKPQVQIGEEEINGALDRIRANLGKPEYLVAEIFLAVDSPAREDEVRRLAERLEEQIRRGAAFSAVARQFSQGGGAAVGGDLGWVQPGQFPEELDQVLRGMRTGQMSRPVRDMAGYHILLVRNQRVVGGTAPTEEEAARAAQAAAPRPQAPVKRPPPQIKVNPDAKVRLKQAILPLADPGQRSAVMRKAADFSKSVTSCDGFEGKAAAIGAHAGDAGTVRLGDMPPQLAQMMAMIPVGRGGPPMSNTQQVVVLVVCHRDANAAQVIEAPMPPQPAPPPPVAAPPPRPSGPVALPSRDQVSAALGNERLEMLQRRYLIDLRRSAFVDIRMGDAPAVHGRN